jgi:hypothetical protein
METRIRTVFAALAAGGVLIGVTACDRKSEAAGATQDTSEVVARFDGEPITLNDLQTEDPNAGSPSAYQAALANILDRKLLARAAAAAATAGDLELAYEQEKAGEIALANARGRQLVKDAPSPSATDIDRFIREHPEAFSNRRFLIVDQIEVRGAKGQLEGLPVANSLDVLAGQLDTAKIPYQRTLGVIDTANAQPNVVQRLTSTPSGSLFTIGDAQLTIVGQVSDVRTIPFTNAFARQVAANLIKSQGLREAVRKDLQTLRAEAVDEIEYVAGYARPARSSPTAPSQN